MNGAGGFGLWARDHMVLVSSIAYGVVAVIIAAVILSRWYFSKSAWPFHPGGSSGFLKDEFMRLGAIFIPYVIVMMLFRFFVYDMHPELAKSPIIFVVLASVIVFRRMARFIPFVKSAGDRVDSARKMAREAAFSA